MRHLTYVAFGMFMGIENYMNIRRDVGAHIRTHKSDGSDIGKFMTPTLRLKFLSAPNTEKPWLRVTRLRLLSDQKTTRTSM